MPTETEMTGDEPGKSLLIRKPRSLKAGRKERRAFLTEMEQVTALHRTSLTPRMRAVSLRGFWRSSKRPCVYGVEVERVVRKPVGAFG
jgi:hypothetical protein